MCADFPTHPPPPLQPTHHYPMYNRQMMSLATATPPQHSQSNNSVLLKFNFNSEINFADYSLPPPPSQFRHNTVYTGTRMSTPSSLGKPLHVVASLLLATSQFKARPKCLPQLCTLERWRGGKGIENSHLCSLQVTLLHIRECLQVFL